MNTQTGPLQPCHEIPTVLRNLGQYLKHDDAMCSLSQLLLYLLTGGKKTKYILSFLFQVGLPVLVHFQ